MLYIFGIYMIVISFKFAKTLNSIYSNVDFLKSYKSINRVWLLCSEWEQVSLYNGKIITIMFIYVNNNTVILYILSDFVKIMLIFFTTNVLTSYYLYVIMKFYSALLIGNFKERRHFPMVKMSEKTTPSLRKTLLVFSLIDKDQILKHIQEDLSSIYEDKDKCYASLSCSKKDVVFPGVECCDLIAG